MFRLLLIIIPLAISYYFGAYDRIVKYYGKFMRGEEITISDLQEDMGDLTKMIPKEMGKELLEKHGGMPKNFAMPDGMKGDMKGIDSLGGEEKEKSAIVRPKRDRSGSKKDDGKASPELDELFNQLGQME